MVLMDVDGVMTDGGILFVGGRSEGRVFDVKDGVGVWLLHRAGVATGIISGRTSAAVRRRARELRMDEIHLKAADKLAVYEKILRRRRLTDPEVCFIGDDVVDLPVLARVGLPVAVHDATVEVRRAARLVTRAPGGRGAVREVADRVLRAQGRMGELLRRYEGNRR
jgi:3-deoxy-D-manno-octulosonate 8-phosphate phosphatase (KDO 8-P phosphatase)